MNIQQTIIEGLKGQLSLHDYIVLPGFGGFVLRHRPAHFGAGGNALFPPSKTVTFNAQLKQNDGIMASWLCEHTGCIPAQATAHLNDFSGYCHGVLSGHRRLTLPGIGFFYLDFEDNLCFDPQSDQNFLAASFGLQPLQLTGTKQVPTRKTVFEDRKITTTVSRRKTGSERLRRAALPAALFLFTAMFTVMLVSVSEFRGELRAALGGTSGAGTYQPAGYSPLKLSAPSPSQPLVADANGIARLTLAGREVPVKVEVPGRSVETKYQIILGCFEVPSNARKMVRQMKRQQIDARISPVKHRGMMVVTAGSYSEREQAMADLPAVRRVIPAAWIRSTR